MANISWNKDKTMAVLTCLVICLVRGTLAVSANNNVSQTSLITEFLSEESQTGAIVVRWNISEDVDFKELVIIHTKIGGEFTSYSSPQYNLTQEFTITDLIANTKYSVCLSVKLTDDKPCPVSDCQSCIEMGTIPLIRDDSLIAVILTVGAILLLIVIGCLCWHYAKKKQEEFDEEDDSESLIGSDESKQPILLAVPPTSNGPRRSVDFEDQDIPYITPPVDDVKQEQNNKRREFFSQP